MKLSVTLSQIITIHIIDDILPEIDEMFVIRLQGALTSTKDVDEGHEPLLVSPTSGASIVTSGDSRRLLTIGRNDGPNGLVQFAIGYPGDEPITSNDTRFLPAHGQIKVLRDINIDRFMNIIRTRIYIIFARNFIIVL